MDNGRLSEEEAKVRSEVRSAMEETGLKVTPIRKEASEEVGDVRIADDVIRIVAALSAQEVPGVLGMSSDLTDDLNKLIGKEEAGKGVRLRFENKTVDISVYVVLEYGYCIPEVALVIQERVKEAVENMTGYEVQFVDVHIEGVRLRPETTLEKMATLEEDMADIVKAQARRAEATVDNSFEMQLANYNNFTDPEEEEENEKHKRFWEED